MPALHNRDRDVSDYREQRQDDREISLGTGTILGIFFGLALLCAVFFGFGYSMGRKSAPAAPLAASSPTPATNSFSLFKPAAGNPASQASSSGASRSATKETKTGGIGVPSDPDATIVTSVDEAKQAPVAPRSAAADAEEASNSVPKKLPVKSVGVAPAASIPMPAINPNGTTMVQVAAVSHQEDADVLLSALKKRGYAVFIRQEPQDHLLHVQVGPFANRKDADAMRQRLLGDGYNAIVK